MKNLKDLDMKDSKALSSLSAKDLNEEINKVAKKLFALKMKKNAGELKQTHLITHLRRYVAKMKTFASQK